VTAARRLEGIRGVLLDLDGCVWRGSELVPGAIDLLAGLRARGIRRLFLSNNSTESVAHIAGRLDALGIPAGVADVVAPLGIIGAFVRERQGPCRVLVVGAEELAEAMRAAGHTVVPHAAYKEAQAVVSGRDEEFTFATLTAAARSLATGAAFYVCNLDVRLPVEGGEFLPGAGPIAEAIAIAGGVRPIMLGKPEPHLFRVAVDRLGLPPRAVAMVGDTLATDILGAHRAGMSTALFAPDGPPPNPNPAPDITVTHLPDLLALI
jgi:HAD superfamily hydrolase (TIGR01450 family)